MTQTTEAALGGLAQCASISAVDRGLAARLMEARALLNDDLSWVEQALVQTSAEGPSPGRDASQHLVGLGGKRVRPMTLLLSSACFGEVPDASRHLAVSVELIHSATLLHDDVIDEGTERRGESSARMVWGNAVSVLGGDLMLTHALLTAHQHAPELMGPLLATLRHLVNGEIVQLRGRSQIEVSEEIYSSILRDKTAALFRFAARAGAQLAGATERHQSLLADFGECLGMAFQLIDDLLDYTGTATGKTMFADLAQGKLTLPLVLAVQKDSTLLRHLEEIRGGDHLAVDTLRRKVMASGVCDRVLSRALSHTSRAIEHLNQLPPSPARSLLIGVAQQLADRSH